MVKLFSKNSNLCDHNSPTLQTDRQTTCNRNTALCTKVHRAVKTQQIPQSTLIAYVVTRVIYRQVGILSSLFCIDRWFSGDVAVAYCVLAGRMLTAKSYLWLIQFKTKMRYLRCYFFNSKVITFTHLFLGCISFLNLCRLFSHIGYAARHIKETILKTQATPRKVLTHLTMAPTMVAKPERRCDCRRGTPVTHRETRRTSI